MQSELKSCPFCGWATGLSVFDRGGQPYWVECHDCCAQGAPEETTAEAITAWNTRAGDAEIERLTEALRNAEERERALREALVVTEGAIAEYYRYWTGGETRGSYDGKPERAGLWKARQIARQSIAAAIKDQPHADA